MKFLPPLILIFGNLLCPFCSQNPSDPNQTESSAEQESSDLTSRAAAYNDRLVALQNGVVKPMQEFNSALSYRNTDTLQEKLSVFQSAVTAAADDISEIGAFEGDSTLKNAHLDMMEFMEELAYSDFVFMVNSLLNPESSDDSEIDNLEEKLNTTGKTLEKKLQDIQRKFAQKYNLVLTPGKILF